MAIRMQQRRGTAAEWSAANPVLADGEAGYERDTGVFKVGDGVTTWNNLKPAGNSVFVSANPTLTVTDNPDGSVASTIENGITTTFTYNTDGTVNTQTRAGVTRTFTYSNGNVTGAS